MIAIDTNILVYAHRRDSPFHARADDAIRRVAEGSRSWGIPWPCVHEFYAVVTHPKVYAPPSTPTQAFDQLEAWTESPVARTLGEGVDHLDRLRTLVSEGRVVGPRVHDARIAAICLAAGVSELWSIDRDFSRFPSLTVLNPLA